MKDKSNLDLEAESMISIPDSMCLLTCKCGHEADIEEFQQTPITGKLPCGTYQCPSCRKAWRMESQGKGEFYPSGLYIPAKRNAVSIPTML